MNRMIRPITLCFAGVMAMVMGVLIISQLPTRRMVFSFRGPDRPPLDLSVAPQAKRRYHPSGVTEISLNRKGRWMASGQPFDEVGDLGVFLAERAETTRAAGREPNLRLRIPWDAPAGYMRDAAMTAEELGYEILLVAVYWPEE